MSLETFIKDPWKKSHPSYENRAFFHIRPAPEFATAEVVVASLYRAAGFVDLSEKEVPRTGREFDNDSFKPQLHAQTGSKVDLATWRVVLHSVLESPKQPNQSSKRFLQMCPVVPSVALYSGSARLAGNSWNPGQLVSRMVSFGTPNQTEANALWEKLFKALSVSNDDDIWARWLNQEFELRRKKSPAWRFAPLQSSVESLLPEEDKLLLEFPAHQFVRDLEGIVEAKPFMTRRQWVSLLEAILRLSAVAHVLWLCELNYKVWSTIRNILQKDAHPPGIDEVRARVVSSNDHFLTYGNPGGPVSRDCASRYLVARLGINTVLWQLNEMGVEVKSLSSCAELVNLFKLVSEKKAHLQAAGTVAIVTELQEEHSRTIVCKKGIGSNVVEFVRYVLGQRQTADEKLRGYDQGYMLRKKAEHRNAPWIVSMGPVAILALVHCCLRDAAGPRSIQKLCQHLAHYGIHVNRDDVTASDLGKKLRMLGLVLDSPDAESGMLLVPPFGGNTLRRSGLLS